MDIRDDKRTVTNRRERIKCNLDSRTNRIHRQEVMVAVVLEGALAVAVDAAVVINSCNVPPDSQIWRMRFLKTEITVVG